MRTSGLQRTSLYGDASGRAFGRAFAGALACTLTAVSTAAAEERPDESEIFGAPSQDPSAPDAPREPERKAGEEQRPDESEIFGGEQREAGEAAPAVDVAPDDPLRLGGQFYLRSQLAAGGDALPVSDWAVAAPALVDGYFDARPNDRVRGMLVARLTFDPTVDPRDAFPGVPVPDPGPNVALDQLWINFDVERAVFVTAGRQHVKWGTGRFWNPTDFLHPVRRDPLARFDARLGVTMLKLHAPVESAGANFYAIAALEGAEPADRLDRVGGALRAEIAIGPGEVGLSGLVQRSVKPRLGADASFGIGAIDVYGEVALKQGSDAPLWRRTGNLVAGGDPTAIFESFRPDGLRPAATAGANWSGKYNDTDLVTIGAEYYYDANGYDDESVYPWLLFQRQFMPFYLGKHYAALYAVLPQPGMWNDTTFILSNLANVSDLSAVTRLDASVLVQRHLQVEGFGAVHYGNAGGEFRFGFELPDLVVEGQPIAPIAIPTPLFELGVALRIDV